MVKSKVPILTGTNSRSKKKQCREDKEDNEDKKTPIYLFHWILERSTKCSLDLINYASSSAFNVLIKKC